MKQKTKDSFWKDETGMKIPVGRITPIERLMERQADKLLQKAILLNKQMTDFKTALIDASNEVYERFMAQRGIDPSLTKGNFTWFNFDRSIKIEVSIKERITFDDMTIKAAQERLNQFLSETVESRYDFVKDLVQDAFATSRGKLDAKKVLSLTRYRERVDHPLFSEDMKLIDQSIRRPDQKTYFRIWHRQENGEYQAIELNFSNILL